ncbi:Transposon Ty3-G Gag-Pol poly [Paramuricea clavata]|uniref:Transposon Ty3-G Gag-Pol poly n=1 Tax=Paramuricea clavata TaxID=317549 RepID=A0A6S7FZ98_PARCT|nr:Transposon Ty3-G Gag-Pol poly [Paramuricea clavata]
MDKGDEDILTGEAKGFVDQVLKELPCTEDRLNELRVHLKQDEGDLTVQDGLLLHGKRLVIHSSMRLDILSKIHSGHLGITKCREEQERQCGGLLKGKTYLIIIDYFSGYPEIALLNSITSTSVIMHMKSCFARHGIPDRVISDNGPQFSSVEFSKFSSSYGFKHQTSSPRYPQANGKIERAVKTVKSLLKKSKDQYIALMSYRDTPLENGYSPAELLFGRKIQTTLPVVSQHLVPTWPYLVAVREKEERIKKRQKKNRKESGTIINKFETPSSYVVKTPTTTVRRYRRHLIEDPSKNTCEEPQEATSTTSGTAVPENNPGYYTRSSRLSAPPDRLVY